MGYTLQNKEGDWGGGGGVYNIVPTEARFAVLGERKPTPPEGNYQLTEIP